MTAIAPRLEPRPGPARCCVCHDDALAAEPCDGCGALTHDECLLATRGCPTLGCAWAGELEEDRPDPKAGAVPRVEAPAEPDRPPPGALPALVVVGLLLLVLSAFADRLVFVHGQRIDPVWDQVHLDRVDVLGAR